MGIIQNLMAKLRARKERMSDAEEQLNIQKKLQERQMSSNERELQSYLKEEREKQIKKAVEHYRKKKSDEYFYGNQGFKDKRNIFKGQSSLLHNEKGLHRGKRLYMS